MSHSLSIWINFLPASSELFNIWIHAFLCFQKLFYSLNFSSVPLLCFCFQGLNHMNIILSLPHLLFSLWYFLLLLLCYFHSLLFSCLSSVSLIKFCWHVFSLDHFLILHFWENFVFLFFLSTIKFFHFYPAFFVVVIVHSFWILWFKIGFYNPQSNAYLSISKYIVCSIDLQLFSASWLFFGREFFSVDSYKKSFPQFLQ